MLKNDLTWTVSLPNTKIFIPDFWQVQTMTEQNLFKIGAKIIERLEENNYEGYFVGGAVRDYTLGRAVSDVDITTNALPDEIEALFDKTIDVGKEHGTIIVLMDGLPFEVTTYRVEGTYTDHRRPDNVFFTQHLKEDLSRRDFTINAMAMTADMDLYDPYNGLKDLKSRLSIQSALLQNASMKTHSACSVLSALCRSLILILLLRQKKPLQITPACSAILPSSGLQQSFVNYTAALMFKVQKMLSQKQICSAISHSFNISIKNSILSRERCRWSRKLSFIYTETAL